MQVTEANPSNNQYKAAQDQNNLSSDPLTVNLSQLSISSAATDVCPPTPDSPLQPSIAQKSGWHKLPPECVNAIVEALEHDANSLATLLRVNRQCFFHVVPHLYRDPFQRIRDVIMRKNSSIRLSSPRGQPHPCLPPSPPLSPSDISHRPFHMGHPSAENSICSVARYNQDMDSIDKVFRSIERREHQLLVTLLSTLYQGLVSRFPVMEQFYHVHFSKSRPHSQTVTWTSQYYLRHWVVLDLQKLYTRGQTWMAPTLYFTRGRRINATTGKNGVFARDFSLFSREFQHLGAADFLQRAILSQPGADRIRTLRIPISRLRTYQQRHERAPRPGKISSRTEKARRRVEEQHQQHQQDPHPYTVDGAVQAHSRSCAGIAQPPWFTWDKLTNIRRLEIFNMTENACDWETLRRVLGTIQYGDYQAQPGTHHDTAVGFKDLDTIREFSLETQGGLRDFTTILGFLRRLEVLEVLSDDVLNRPFLLHWDPMVCENLKALRMGTVIWSSNGLQGFEHLSRFRNLEELRITVTSGDQFQWLVDAKRKDRLKQQLLQAHAPIDGMLVPDGNSAADSTAVNWSHSQASCLPKLKILALTALSEVQIPALFDACEGWGEQLEELILNIPNSPDTERRFAHPLPRVRRLALRGGGLGTFDFSSISRFCPVIELLAFQHTSYVQFNDLEADYDSLVEALVQLHSLRCLYLEGLCLIQDREFMALATGCRSLYKIGIHYCPHLGMDKVVEADVMLAGRKTKYPLRAKGVFRLPSATSEPALRSFSWRMTFFGHEDN
ncbi:hypothetical protein BGZ68_007707 [Mortierella alpina]|nr:hypothetical protein BGZ68_007707 [Mortierella alpina]